MARTAGQGEHTKKLIAQKAQKLFEQKGYAATTMELIHAETGFSKGSIYYHFKNKEDLFLYILELSSKRWMITWKEISAPLSSATEKLYKLAEHYVSDLQNPLLQTAIEFTSSEVANPEVHEQLVQWIQSDHLAFHEVLDEGMRNGEFVEASVDDLAIIINGLHNGLSMTQHKQDTNNLYRLYRTAIDIILNGIAK